MKQARVVVSDTEDGDGLPLKATLYERLKVSKSAGRLIPIFFAFIASGEQEEVAA